MMKVTCIVLFAGSLTASTARGQISWPSVPADITAAATADPDEPIASSGDKPDLRRGRFDRSPADGSFALEQLDVELQFTEAQKQEIQTMIAAQRKALSAAMTDVVRMQQALDDAIMRTPYDYGLVETRVGELLTTQMQITLTRAQTEARIYHLLSAEQQQKAQQCLYEMRLRRLQSF